MQHSELRRGNYVDTGKTVGQVSRIKLQTEPAGAWPIVGIGATFYYPHMLKGVAISVAWLQKLGFTTEEVWPSKFGSYFYRDDRKVKVGMSQRFGITISLNNTQGSDEYMIDYVHELQNIYQNLTGELI